MQLRFSRRAEVDLEGIGEYILLHDPARAASYLRKLLARCERLLEYPDAAPLRPEFGDGVRMAVFGNHLIFYVVRAKTLEVLRVLHAARDLSGGLQ